MHAEDVAAEIDRAEREGIGIALLGRSIVLAVVALWFLFGVVVHGISVIGLIDVLIFLAAGLLLRRHILAGGAKLLMYVFTAAEILALGAFFALAPLSLSAEVPQIQVFRAYGFGYFLVLIAVGTLSLSPWLVLWAGAVTCVALWGAFLWIVAGMERTVSWSALPPGHTAEQYLGVVLDPSFIGIGNRVEETIVIAAVSGLLAYAVHRARRLMLQRALMEQRQRRAYAVFGQFVPDEVVRRLVDEPGTLAPRRMEASVLFLDIAGFTRFAEQRDPAEVIRMLNTVFEAATETIAESGGIVIGFPGDAVIATFAGADGPDRSAAAAVRAAEQILTRIRGLSFDGAPIGLRIGLASGTIAAGSVGGRTRQAYTAYGDPVNLAQRLQELAKRHGTALLACETTCRRAGLAERFREIELAAIRGRTEPVRVFAPA